MSRDPIGSKKEIKIEWEIISQGENILVLQFLEPLVMDKSLNSLRFRIQEGSPENDVKTDRYTMDNLLSNVGNKSI